MNVTDIDAIRSKDNINCKVPSYNTHETTTSQSIARYVDTSRNMSELRCKKETEDSLSVAILYCNIILISFIAIVIFELLDRLFVLLAIKK